MSDLPPNTVRPEIGLIERVPSQAELAERKAPIANNIGGKARALDQAGVEPPKPGTPEFFGLPRTGFLVKRKAGQIESDWEITAVRSDPNGGQRAGILDLKKYDPLNNRISTKTIRRDEWESWQMEGDEPTDL